MIVTVTWNNILRSVPVRIMVHGHGHGNNEIIQISVISCLSLKTDVAYFYHPSFHHSYARIYQHRLVSYLQFDNIFIIRV
jgi:hypothetical protein